MRLNASVALIIALQIGLSTQQWNCYSCLLLQILLSRLETVPIVKLLAILAKTVNPP